MKIIRNRTNKQPADTHKSASFKQRASLSSFLSLTVIITTLLVGLCVASYAITVVRENKLSDVWAILYLQFERESRVLSDKFGEMDGQLLAETEIGNEKQSFDAVYSYDGKLKKLVKVTGALPELLDLKELGLDDLRFQSKITLLQCKGQNYLAKVIGGNRLYLSYIDMAAMVQKTFGSGTQPDHTKSSKRYMINRQGSLLFSSSPDVVPATVIQRKLVQKFIQSPVSRGFFTIEQKGNDDTYGYFYEIPATNVIMFAEAPVWLVTDPVSFIIKRFVGIILFAMGLAFLAIQVALLGTNRSLRMLVSNAKQIAGGRFDIPLSVSGWGEINALSNAFAYMSNSLMARDSRIAALHNEEKDKLRLANELEVASRLQKNFLPTDPLPVSSGIDLYSMYVPAVETAGDWYHHHYDETREEVIVAMADVSGHGAGSSMFTAIIAGIFADMTSATDHNRFEPTLFAEKLNTIFAKIGKHQWHSTLVVARYRKKEQDLLLMAAGGTQPVHLSLISGAIEAKQISLPSSLIGLAGEFKVNTKIIPFKPGDRIVLYTDGLTEAESPKGKMYGKRRLMERCKKYTASQDSSTIVADLHRDWFEYQKGPASDKINAADDLCLISMRAIP